MAARATPALVLGLLASQAGAASVLRLGAASSQDPVTEDFRRQLAEFEGGTDGTPYSGLPVYSGLPISNSGEAPEGASCTASEKGVLLPVLRVETRMWGKAVSGRTDWPATPPPACRLRNRQECYIAWGFTARTAACYEEESIKGELGCGICGRGGYRDTEGCQTCLATLRNQRRSCVFKAMGVSTTCQNCQRKAYQHYEQHCAMECPQTFVTGVVTASALCRKCNDEVDALLSQCGAM